MARSLHLTRGSLAPRAISAIGFLVVWELAATFAHSRLFPAASAVALTMIQEAVSGSLLSNLAITLARVAAAFTVAMVLGTALGFAMGIWRRVDLALDSWVTVLLNLPALVLIVLMYVWFGLNEWAAIAAVALNKLPSTAVMVREGTRALDRNLVEMAQSFRLGRVKTFRHVTLPQLAPYLFAAARSGLAIIWKIVLVVELLGRSNGVGFQIEAYFQLFDVTHILAYTLAFIFVVQAIEWVFLQPLERRVSRWRR
ncbi:MAG: ABC transporter permease [Acidobacteriia bacterium]|nr:ABC transporter permease [Methyloceanibacter sp.]MCL6491684.1 ABC transporter permease [Terriglobia bacterium]